MTAKVVGKYRIVRPTAVGLLSRGKNYSVKDLGETPGGYTNLLRKELGVSLDASRGQTRWTQLHELSHVQHSMWSPERIVKTMARRGVTLTHESVLAAEDARINELLLRKVPDAHRGFAGGDEQLREDLSGYAACHCAPAERKAKVRMAINPQHAAAIDAFHKRIAGMSARNLTVLRVTVPLAQLLMKLSIGGEGGEQPQPQPGEQKQPGAGERTGEPNEDGEDEDEQPEEAGGSGADEDEDEDDSAAGGGVANKDEDDENDGAAGEDAATDAKDAAAFGESDIDEQGFGCAPPMTDEDGPATWAPATVLESALTVPMRGGNFQVATGETGTTLRWAHLHRIATDGVVFRRMRRRPGALQRGTVLIDVSGSMSLENAQVAALVEMMPHATVAIYSGTASHRPGQSVGHIVVVARDGRRVADIASDDIPRHRGNAIDGPALLWLSRMPAPRLWISDGQVWGMGGRRQSHDDECAAIMQAAGIVQVYGTSNYGDSELRATRTKVRQEGTIDVGKMAGVLRDIERGRI